jgi:hypothetical protein
MSTTERIVPPAESPAPRADRPEGPVVAAVLACGIGSLALGVVTTLAEASPAFKDLLAWNQAVGPLSGKTAVAVIVWLLAWAILHAVFRNKPVETRRALTVALVLVGLGVVGTFPTFFEAFAAG